MTLRVIRLLTAGELAEVRRRVESLAAVSSNPLGPVSGGSSISYADVVSGARYVPPNRANAKAAHRAGGTARDGISAAQQAAREGREHRYRGKGTST